MSNNLDLDQDQRFVEPDLAQTVGKGYQQETEFVAGRQGDHSNKLGIHNKISYLFSCKSRIQAVKYI